MRADCKSARAALAEIANPHERRLRKLSEVRITSSKGRNNLKAVISEKTGKPRISLKPSSRLPRRIDLNQKRAVIG